jgi:DNA-binding CsgD family transcriptional regulator
MEGTESIALTRAEIEVMKLMVSGLSNSEISAYTGMGTDEVKRHVKSIFLKLEAISPNGDSSELWRDSVDLAS